jgi:hypothetical protein
MSKKRKIVPAESTNADDDLDAAPIISSVGNEAMSAEARKIANGTILLAESGAMTKMECTAITNAAAWAASIMKKIDNSYTAEFKCNSVPSITTTTDIINPKKYPSADIFCQFTLLCTGKCNPREWCHLCCEKEPMVPYKFKMYSLNLFAKFKDYLIEQNKLVFNEEKSKCNTENNHKLKLSYAEGGKLYYIRIQIHVQEHKNTALKSIQKMTLSSNSKMIKGAFLNFVGNDINTHFEGLYDGASLIILRHDYFLLIKLFYRHLGHNL